MNDPIVLLAVLNIIPSTLHEILSDIASLRRGREHPPFGGSSAISGSVRETDGRPGPLEPFHTAESCAEHLHGLVRLGLVKKDDAGYRLTYEGLILTAEVVRRIQKKYRPHPPALASAAREVQPNQGSSAELSPISQKKLLEELVKRFSDERKN